MQTTKNPIDVATHPENTNIFSDKMQMQKDRVTLEVVPDNTDAEIKVILMVSASGNNFAKISEDAEVIIPAGSATVVVAFEGLTPMSFLKVYLDKGDATGGTLTASLL